MLKILDYAYDEVIGSKCLMIKVDYEFILKKTIPLIRNFEHQREMLLANKYKILENNIKLGCIMQAFTLGIIDDNVPEILDEEYLMDKIDYGFIIDGMQRLNVIEKINNENPETLKNDKSIYLSIIITNSIDKLLYKMITLNTGQKPVSVKQQIERLTQNMYNFDEKTFDMVSENESKDRKNINKLEKDDIVMAYLAFVTESTNIDIQKTIENKMDELIINNIINSKINKRDYEFKDIINLILDLMGEHEISDKWFKDLNNLVGFCSGIAKGNTYKDIMKFSKSFVGLINNLETALKILDVSKVKLSKMRRKYTKYITQNYSEVMVMEEYDLLDRLSSLG
jgi:hypothetical protein